MKTIKTVNGSIRRVKNEVALRLVDNKDYFYCGKEEWKREVRGPVKKVEVKVKEAKDDSDN